MASENVDYHVDCKVNAIKIGWHGNTSKTQTYIVRYQIEGTNAMYQLIQTKENEVLIPNLIGGMLYKIKVFIQDDNGDERLYFCTTASTAAPIISPFIDMSDKISDKPTIYKFRPSYIRDIYSDVRLFEMGSDKESLKPVGIDKTILFVGARASGKSTLIDAMINYVVAVLYVDDYRFKLVDDGCKSLTKSSDSGGTKRITCYKVSHLNGFNVGYGLTVIDSPGFDEQEESNHNFNIIQQLTNLLKAEIVTFIDAVCLVLPSSCRLTEGQRSIFCSIKSLFGKDINCFIPMFTFDDGGKINALRALKKAEVPYMDHMYFRFNNSGLFNIIESEESWNRRYDSFKDFFGTLFAKQSVRLTSEVLNLRCHLYEQTKILQKKQRNYGHQNKISF